MSPDDFPPGSVWLVGAGPGDPELLTRKAERLLQLADVVFHDALVGPGVLDLVPSGVVRVSVGKRSGRHSKEQSAIDALLVRATLEGKRVIRLKGGDPAIFARSEEEISALHAAGIRVRICPGITTASAAAASARMSLSLRGIARSTLFVTAHARRGEDLDLDWDALANAQSTLAFYMGREAAGEISVRLMEAGMPPQTSVLVACDVSLESERLLATRLDLLPLAAAALAQNAPTIILIGEAVAKAYAASARLPLQGTRIDPRSAVAKSA